MWAFSCKTSLVLPPYQYLAKCRARGLFVRAPFDFIEHCPLFEMLPLLLSHEKTGNITSSRKKFLFFREMLSERRDALDSPRRKKGIKALFDIFFRCHVKAVCDFSGGACDAVIQFLGIVQAHLFAAGGLLPQAHIYAAYELGLFAVVLLKMRALCIIGGGKIGLDLFCNFVVVKEIAPEEKAHQLAQTIKPRQDRGKVMKQRAQDKFQQHVGILRHFALLYELLPILPCDEVAVIAAVIAEDHIFRLLKHGRDMPLRDAELLCDLRLRHILAFVEVDDVPLLFGEGRKRPLFVEAVMDEVGEGLALIKPLLLLLGREGVLVDVVTNGLGVAEVSVRVVVFQTVQLAQRLPFALRHLDDGIRLAAHVTVGPIGGVAGVVIEMGAWRLAR